MGEREKPFFFCVLFFPFFFSFSFLLFTFLPFLFFPSLPFLPLPLSFLDSSSGRKGPVVQVSHRCSGSLGSSVLQALALTVAVGVPEALLTQHLSSLIPIASGHSCALALMMKVTGDFKHADFYNISVALSHTHEYRHTYTLK